MQIRYLEVKHTLSNNVAEITSDVNIGPNRDFPTKFGNGLDWIGEMGWQLTVAVLVGPGILHLIFSKVSEREE